MPVLSEASSTFEMGDPLLQDLELGACGEAEDQPRDGADRNAEHQQGEEDHFQETASDFSSARPFRTESASCG